MFHATQCFGCIERTCCFFNGRMYIQLVIILVMIYYLTCIAPFVTFRFASPSIFVRDKYWHTFYRLIVFCPCFYFTCLHILFLFCFLSTSACHHVPMSNACLFGFALQVISSHGLFKKLAGEASGINPPVKYISKLQTSLLKSGLLQLVTTC